MSATAIVFPGQGTQAQGMGLDFVAAYSEARQVFAQAATVLPFSPLEACGWDGARLALTEFAQPCILTVQIAMLAALRARHGLTARFFGGHSLGEFSALVAAGALPLPTAVRLVHRRGQLMQEAVPVGQGGMVALTLTKGQLPLAQLQQLAADSGVDLANDNSPGQVVASGAVADLEALRAALAPLIQEGLRLVPLAVSVPFHSRWLRAAEERFREVLEAAAADFEPAASARVTSNFTGTFHTGKLPDLLDALARQVAGTVRWRENMAALVEVADRIIEVGPKRPLAGFFRSLGLKIDAVTDTATAAKLEAEP